MLFLEDMLLTKKLVKKYMFPLEEENQSKSSWKDSNHNDSIQSIINMQPSSNSVINRVLRICLFKNNLEL